MKKIIILAIICLLASASPVSAQLIIRNVTLCDGFEVESGASFSVIPSTF